MSANLRRAWTAPSSRYRTTTPGCLSLVNNVRLWPLADIQYLAVEICVLNVRFTPGSGHWSMIVEKVR